MNIAAGNISATPRDEPNAGPDHEALKLVKPYQGMVAWGTVCVAIAIVAAFALVTTLATLRIIPLWLGLILNSFILYLDQTPLHEACHGNIAGKDSRYLWLNHLIGYVSGAILLHEYKAFRFMHLAHHRDTNDPSIDPDHWVAVKNPFLVLFRCLTIVFWYHQYFWKHIAFHAHIPGMRPLTIHIAAMYALLYSIALGLSVLGYWREVLMLWIVPHILASALIIYFFAYLTHKPHEVHERYRDTNVFWVKGKIAEPIANWLYMFQNFHLIHHLFPRIPFYPYPKAFRELKPVLKREQAHIYEYDFGR
ncbi:MAG: fatty acid desaturase [Methyloceanibacter sp.]|nr:fatty acid desaturase [Methyloceanibacter sp.]